MKTGIVSAVAVQGRLSMEMTPVHGWDIELRLSKQLSKKGKVAVYKIRHNADVAHFLPGLEIFVPAKLVVKKSRAPGRESVSERQPIWQSWPGLKSRYPLYILMGL
jgi:hypothetical protein